MRRRERAAGLVLTAVFADLTAVGAFIRLPMGYSSFTLQLLFVFLAGLVLGKKRAAAAQALYVALGLIGLPVFSGGGGIGYVMQPTFGFILGLIPAAWVTGALSGGSRAAGKTIPACLAGLAAVYLIGMPYMALILNVYMGKGIPFLTLITAYMLPFLPFDALKIAAAVLAAAPLSDALERIKKYRSV